MRRIRYQALLVLLPVSVALLSVIPSVAVAVSKNSTTPVGSGPSPPALAWPLNPGSSQTLAISNLFWIILAESGVVFILIVIALVINFVRYSARKGDTSEPEQRYGNRRIEVLWTLIPAVILLVAFVLTVVVMNDVNTTSAAPANEVHVTAIGHQWWWEFRYPGKHVTTANLLNIPMGKTTVVSITSADVLHSLWIPQLNRQMTAIPNQTKVVYITPSRTGMFPGACYEFCGQGHAWMEFRANVESPAKYRVWLTHQAKPAASPSTGPAAAGESIFFAESCSSCHTINGTPANGKFAPNLTHESSKWAIAGGALRMSKQNLQRWVANPEAYKQGAQMPAFQSLGKHKLDELASYLWTLK